jgi:hypothetical protein
MYASDRERLFISILIAVVVWVGFLLLLWRADLIPEPPDISYRGPIEVVLDTTETAELSRQEVPPVEEEQPREEASPTEDAATPSEETSSPAESPSAETSLPQRETAPASQAEGETSPAEIPSAGPDETEPEAGSVSEEPPSEDTTTPKEDTKPKKSEVFERSKEEARDSQNNSDGTGQTSGEESGEGEGDFFEESDDSRLEKALKEKEQLGAETDTEGESGTGAEPGTEGVPLEEGSPENPVDPEAMGTNVVLVKGPKPDISEDNAKTLPPTKTLLISFIVSPTGLVSQLKIIDGSGNSEVDQNIAAKIKNDWIFNNKRDRNVRVYLRYTIEKE